MKTLHVTNGTSRRYLYNQEKGRGRGNGTTDTLSRRGTVVVVDQGSILLDLGRSSSVTASPRSGSEPLVCAGGTESGSEGT